MSAKSSKPKKSFELVNYYEKFGAVDPSERYYNPYKLTLQHPWRAALLGPTGIGKTNILLNMIELGSNFDEILLFTGGDPHEFLYDNVAKRLGDGFIVFDSPQALIEYAHAAHEADEAEAKEEGKKFSMVQRLAIFDDYISLSAKEQKPIDKFIIYCRKLNCSVCLLSQNFFEMAKTQRKNVNYIMTMANAPPRDLSTIVKQLAPDIGLKKLVKMYQEATAGKEPVDVFIVDGVTKNPLMRCRAGLTIGFDPSKVEIDN